MKTEQWEKAGDVQRRIGNLENAAAKLIGITEWDVQGFGNLLYVLEPHSSHVLDAELPSPVPLLNQFRKDCVSIIEKRIVELKAEFEAL